MQIVRSRVAEEDREAYLRAWREWSGTLYGMNIRTELLESRDERGAFTELTWFEPGDEAALGDDRVVGIVGDLRAAAAKREGDRVFWETAATEAASGADDA